MRGSKRRRWWRCCVRWPLSVLLHVVGRTKTAAETVGSLGEEPWLSTRMLEIPIVFTAAPGSSSSEEGEQQSVTEFTVRFDGLLVDPSNLASRILAAAAPSNSSFLGEEDVAHRWGGWGVEGDQAVVLAVMDALRGAAGSVYDEMEAELVTAAAREVTGDWLEAADLTCKTLVLQRRREILEVYRHGRLDVQSTACSSPAKEDPETIRCERETTATTAAQIVLDVGWLTDSTTSLVACRAFFTQVEREYAKAACLRAARLGELSIDEAVEVDMRLAAIALLHGRPSAAIRLYFRIMGYASTTNDGRLAVSIIGLTMVPPTLIGSLRLIAQFRDDWTRDLNVLRHNLLVGATKGRLWDPYGQVGITPFHLVHQGGPDLELMSALAGVYDAAAPALRVTAPHCNPNGDADGEGASKFEERPIRIGFFSLYLRHHSVGKMITLIISFLSEDPELEVHVFGPDGGNDDDTGEGLWRDPVIDALQLAAQYWHKAPRNLDMARRVVAREKLDILVYPDIGMEALTYFMAFARLAPVQCVWWGHPVTPGTGAIDYFLSLDVEVKEGQAHYMEQMIRMDVVNTAPFEQASPPAMNVERPSELYDGSASVSTQTASSPHLEGSGILGTTTPPATTLVVPAAAAGAAAEQNKHDTDLDLQGSTRCLRTYVVLGRLFKLHPEFDTAIKGVLARDREGCVLLMHETTDEEWTRDVWGRLRDTLLPLGLNDRLRIVHHTLYLETLRGATAVLDTFPYGGCLTVLEALSNGVPVVTLPAKFIRGRFALAIYRQMGYTDLVVEDVEGYVSTAIRLGADKGFRQRALTSLEEGYRLSLHKHRESATEWGAFFRRALRAAG